MNKNEIKKRLSEVVRTDAKIASRSDFLATHVPFDNLEFVSSGRTEHTSFTIDEESFLKERIIDQRNHHNFLVVKGSHGSGKSHFIRWLKERYENEIDTSKEEIIFIERTQSTLKDALEQMSANKVLKNTSGIEEVEKMIEASQNLENQGLKIQLALQLAYLAKNDERESINLNDRYRRNVYEFLTDSNIQEVLSNSEGPLDRIQNRLVPDKNNTRKDEIDPEFKPADFDFDRSTIGELRNAGINRKALRLLEDLNSNRKSELKRNLSNYLNSKLEDAIQNCVKLNSADLKVVFTELRKRLKKENKNLTIFIEDITSFTGIGRGIVEALITEHKDSEEEDLCRLFSLVGITDGYYNNEFPDNIKDRVTGQVLLDNALFYEKNEEEKIVEIAGRYLNAINLKKEKLVDWIDNKGASLNTLPISEKYFDHEWSLIELPEGRKVSLFPFNKNALIKMFNGLIRKTPREFLKSIIEPVYKKFINSNDFPPAPKELSEGKFDIPLWDPVAHERFINKEFQDESDKVKSLILWWGEGNAYKKEEKFGGLHSKVFDSFNIEINKIEGVQKNEEKQRVKNIKNGSNRKKIDENKEYDEKVSDLSSWFNNKESLHSYQNLRDNMIEFIKQYIDWEFHDIPPYLVSTKFNSQTVGIEGQSGIISGKKVYEIKRTDDSYYAFIALIDWVYKGNKTWGFEDATNSLINLQLWIDKNKSNIISSIKDSLNINNNNKLYIWSLISKYYIEILSGSFEKYELDLNEVYNLLLNDNSMSKAEINYKKHSSKTIEILKKEVFKKDFKGKIVNNDKIIKRYYNCYQGNISNASTTDVFVLDAEEILGEIEYLKDINWNLKNISSPSINNKVSSGQNKLWYSNIEIINFLDKHLKTIILEEKKHLK